VSLRESDHSTWQMYTVSSMIYVSIFGFGGDMLYLCITLYTIVRQQAGVMKFRRGYCSIPVWRQNIVLSADWPWLSVVRQWICTSKLRSQWDEMCGIDVSRHCQPHNREWFTTLWLCRYKTIKMHPQTVSSILGDLNVFLDKLHLDFKKII